MDCFSHRPENVQEVNRLDVGDRKRGEVKMAYPTPADPVELARLALFYLRASKVDALAMFVYHDQSEFDQPYTVARVQVSKDGKGWTGDGRWLLGSGSDDGRVQVEIETSSSPDTWWIDKVDL